MYAAGQMLKARDRGRRKIIFLVSDGTDSRNDSHTFDETLLSLLAADVSVYTISVPDPCRSASKFIDHGANQIDKYATIPAATSSTARSKKISIASIQASPNKRAINTR